MTYDAHHVRHHDDRPDPGCWATHPRGDIDCGRDPDSDSDTGLCRTHLEELQAGPREPVTAGWSDQALQLHANLSSVAPSNPMAAKLLRRLEDAPDPSAEAVAIVRGFEALGRALTAAAHTIATGVVRAIQSLADTLARANERSRARQIEEARNPQRHPRHAPRRIDPTRARR